MSDPWETLASREPAPAEDNGEWDQSEDWAPRQTQTQNDSRTRSTRVSPDRNYNRNRDRSPSSPPRRLYRGRDYDRSPQRSREPSRTYRGETSRTFRGRESSRRYEGRGTYRSTRRPNFSSSPSPGFRSPNRVERRKSPSTDSRSISPDNHFKTKKLDRGRSPIRKSKSKETPNEPGPSWTKATETDSPNGPSSLSPWSKAAADIEKNYNHKQFDGWGQALGGNPNGADAWKQSKPNNFSNRRRNGDDEDRNKWRRSRSRGRDRDRRERSPERPRRRERDSPDYKRMNWGTERERRDGSEEKKDEKTSSWEGPKWRDWSVNAFKNSVKDFSLTDFKWGNDNANNHATEIPPDEIKANGENQNTATGDDNGDEIEAAGSIVLSSPMGNDNEEEKVAIKSSENEELRNEEKVAIEFSENEEKVAIESSENEELRNAPDLPPLLYDPWDMDSEPVVRNDLTNKPLGFEKLEDKPETNTNMTSVLFEKPAVDPNPVDPIGSTVNEAPISRLNELDYPPLLVDPWASCEEEKNTICSSWGKKKVRDDEKENAIDAPNSSNWENKAPNSSNQQINATISSNWETKSSPQSSNWESDVSKSSNQQITAPKSSNWETSNVTNSSNLSAWDANPPKIPNDSLEWDAWETNTNEPKSSNWGNGSSNQSNWRKNDAPISSNRGQSSAAPISSNRGRNAAPNSSNRGGYNAANSSNWRTNSSNWGGDNGANSSNRGKTSAPNSSNWVRHSGANYSNRGQNTELKSSNWGGNDGSNSSTRGGGNNGTNSTTRGNNAPSSSKLPNSSNWDTTTPSSSKHPNQKTNVKAKSPIRPPGFENLTDNNPTKPPGFENSSHNPRKSSVSKPKGVSITGNSGAVGSVSNNEDLTFKSGLTDFAEQKIEPFFSKGHISGRAYAGLINKFVAKVIGAVGPGAPRTEEKVQFFLRCQATELTTLAHDYLARYVNRKVVEEVSRSTK